MKNRNLPLKIAAVCFLFSFGQANAQDFKTIIQNHLSAKNGSMKTDIKNFEIINEDFSKSMNGDVVKIQQSHNGIPVYNAIGTALIKSEKVTYYDDSFAKTSASTSKASSASANSSIFSNVAQALGLKNVGQYRLIGIKDTAKDEVANVKNRLIYFPTESNDLKLCYEFIFEEKGTSNYWDIIADANTGEILSEQNLTISCSFHHDAYSHHLSAHTPEGFSNDFSSTKQVGVALAPSDASYRVFALPLESPNHGARTLVNNPWFTDASPDGWHLISGGTNAGNYTNTRGNNVFAYEDKNNLNAPGTSPDGGTGRVFDFPFVENSSVTNINSSTTNLFYLNNKIHDIFYRFGFDESARNFQAYNFGKGGGQNDYVLAESQDGGGLNNANFLTPPDGTSGKMQMYLWDLAVTQRLFYNSPTEAVPRIVNTFISTTFGPALTPTGITADVLKSPVADGCAPLPVGSLAGKIGLIERGTCDFVTKVKNAQNAGAVSAIIYNLPNSAATAGMAGVDATITIPSVLIENVEGVYMKNLLDQGKNVTVTLKFDAANQPRKDGSFDNGIVIHEYGHGISNRNTGNGYSCLNYNNANEQMGEGWSDFFALMLTNRPGDNAGVARGIGTYASDEPLTGGGIRPAKYSPDFQINNYTYARTNGLTGVDPNTGRTIPLVHSIGFIWASMLWDLNWKYVDKYGYSADVAANPNTGSAKVLQVVVDALKLQGCNANFVSGRDAILAADLARTGGADRCMIWSTFAKRGLGLNASTGRTSPVSTTVPSSVIEAISDQIESYEIPAECKNLATSDVSSNKEMSIYPNPAKDEFFIKASSNILGKVSVQIYDASGKLVSSQKISSSDAVNTQALPNGVYIVKVEGLGVSYSSKLMIKK